MTLDEYLRLHPMEDPSFLKIDTDGMELKVLRGARTTLERSRPSLLMELYPRGLAEHGGDIKTLFAFLEELTYTVCDEDDLSPFEDPARLGRQIPYGSSLNVVALPGGRLSRRG